MTNSFRTRLVVSGSRRGGYAATAEALKYVKSDGATGHHRSAFVTLDSSDPRFPRLSSAHVQRRLQLDMHVSVVARTGHFPPGTRTVNAAGTGHVVWRSGPSSAVTSSVRSAAWRTCALRFHDQRPSGEGTDVMLDGPPIGLVDSPARQRQTPRPLGWVASKTAIHP